MTSYSPDAVDAGVKLSFGGNDGVHISAGSYARADVPANTPFWINKHKNYVVSFLVGNQGNAKYWTEQHSPNAQGITPPGCYILPRAPTLTRP